MYSFDWITTGPWYPNAFYYSTRMDSSGPNVAADVMDQTDTIVYLISSHTLFSSMTEGLESKLDFDTELKKLWDYGNHKGGTLSVRSIKQHITFKEQRYVVSLQWKETH